MVIVGHRGASHDAPENTVASMKLAWEQKADWVEIDVHVSKDGRVMVIHDGSTKRTGDKDLAIENSSAEDIRNVDIGSHKGEKYAGERVPFFEEVLATIPAGPHGMLVEIKVDKAGTAVVPVIKKVLTESGKVKQVAIITFDLNVATEFKKAMPKVDVYWLRSANQTPYDANLIKTVKEHGLDGVDLHYAGLTKEFRDMVKAAGLKLHVWTVDDAQEAKRVYKIGIDGLTTNRPGWIREQLGAK